MNQQSVKPRITRHPDGIFAVDADYVRPGYAAAHIIQHHGRAAFVDTGTNYSVPHLLAALDELGIQRDAVDYVFLTHVHMDHAGGAGLLIQHLPNARVLIHPRGVPHMVDPSKLVAASQAVYGADEFRRLYGDVLPVPQDRIVTVPDNYRCDLGGRELELIHTPGHALHHYVIVDRKHGAIFSGDTFGVSYRALDTPQGPFIVPTTSPSQFDPEQAIQSIDRMMSYAPESIYLMHYSRVTGTPRLAALLKLQIQEFVRIARESEAQPDAHNAIRASMMNLWSKLLQQQGSTLSSQEVSDWLAGDLELNAQGLAIWLQRQRKAME
ncbi:MAG: MBL fold metallo-hydrolase [Proteobacteria bacterium]|nr:MBL fold metallo-hydrolase [Pseudomonadota bacterium]